MKCSAVHRTGSLHVPTKFMLCGIRQTIDLSKRTCLGFNHVQSVYSITTTLSIQLLWIRSFVSRSASVDPHQLTAPIHSPGPRTYRKTLHRRKCLPRSGRPSTTVRRCAGKYRNHCRARTTVPQGQQAAAKSDVDPIASFGTLRRIRPG